MIDSKAIYDKAEDMYPESEDNASIKQMSFIAGAQWMMSSFSDSLKSFATDIPPFDKPILVITRNNVGYGHAEVDELMRVTVYIGESKDPIDVDDAYFIEVGDLWN
jgi:hypothetical protein